MEGPLFPSFNMPPQEERRSYDSIAIPLEDDYKDSNRADEDETPTNEYVLNVAFYSFFGFLMFQTFFALIANSQSMLADSEAMAVDAITYLFNLSAERLKHRPLVHHTAQERYERQVQSLALEILPPLLSVVTLLIVTVITIQQALATLTGASDDDDDDVSVPIMLLFSAANLLLDIVNVTCFARTHNAFGLTSLHSEEHRLLLRRSTNDENNPTMNLNMCSAWTHVCADTLRSTAVLVAAGLAFLMPSLDGATADSLAAVAVSFIILVSVIPLLQGLVRTALELRRLIRQGAPVELSV